MASNPKPVYVQRHPVDVETTAVDGVGRLLSTRIWNLSGGGFMAECEERLPVGAHLDLEIPGRGPHPRRSALGAGLAFRRDDTVGCRIDDAAARDQAALHRINKRLR